MEEDNRKYYCRACGVNKGHNSVACTNARGLREIIKLQDSQIEDTMKLNSKIHDLETTLSEYKEAHYFNTRVTKRLLEFLDTKDAR